MVQCRQTLYRAAAKRSALWRFRMAAEYTDGGWEADHETVERDCSLL